MLAVALRLVVRRDSMMSTAPREGTAVPGVARTGWVEGLEVGITVLRFELILDMVVSLVVFELLRTKQESCHDRAVVIGAERVQKKTQLLVCEARPLVGDSSVIKKLQGYKLL